MTPKIRQTLVLTLVALAAACGGIEVRTDYDPAVDFSSYSTFAVLEEAGDDTAPGFWDARIKNAMATVLTGKGWRQVDSPDQADVAVGYQLTTEERSSYSTVHTGWGGYGYGYGGWYDPYWGGGISTSTTQERRYQVGTLIIAMFDQARQEMIFVSTGSDEIDQRERTPQQAQQMADEVVETLLASFPPGS